MRGGADWKFNPGNKARGAAARNAGKSSSTSSSIFADAFTPPNTYRHQQRYSLKAPVKAERGAGGGHGNNNGGGSGKFSDFHGGPSPYKDSFDYDNPNHTRDNIKFPDRRVDHSYDRHAEKCYGMKANRNKLNKQGFVKKNVEHIQCPKTEKINGSYRYEDPAYHYVQDDLVVTVNATTNEFISVRNATKSQLEQLKTDGNLGLDTRPPMILRLRGPNTTMY